MLMKGVSNLVSAVSLITIIVSISYIVYNIATSLFFSLPELQSPTLDRRLPLKIVNPFTEGNKFCFYIYNPNPNPEDINIEQITVGSGQYTYSTSTVYTDCPTKLLPFSRCKVCASVPVSGEGVVITELSGSEIVSNFSVEGTSVPVVSATVKLYQTDYDVGDTLLFGDVNRFFVEINICNVGTGGFTHTAEINVTNAVLESNTLSVDVPPGSCNTYVVEGNTLSPSPVTVTVNLSTYTLETNKDVVFYRRCGDCTSCTGAFTEANSVVNRFNVDAVVHLTNPLTISSTCINLSNISAPEGRWIYFDGNGYKVDITAPDVSLLYFSDSNGIGIRRVYAEDTFTPVVARGGTFEFDCSNPPTQYTRIKVDLSAGDINMYDRDASAIYSFNIGKTCRFVVDVEGCSNGKLITYTGPYTAISKVFAQNLKFNNVSPDCVDDNTYVSSTAVNGVLFVSEGVSYGTTYEWSLTFSSPPTEAYWTYYNTCCSPAFYVNGTQKLSEGDCANPCRTHGALYTTLSVSSTVRVGLYHYNLYSKPLMVYFPGTSIVSLAPVNDGEGFIVFNLPDRIEASVGKMFEFNITVKNPTNSTVNTLFNQNRRYYKLPITIDDVLSDEIIGMQLCENDVIPDTLPPQYEENITVKCIAPSDPGTYYLRIGPMFTTLVVR